MATFIALVDYTAKGVAGIHQSPQRAAAFIEEAQAAGVTVKEHYWTFGSHDGVLILEAEDTARVSAVLLALASKGNVKTTTLRAFDRREMEAILGQVS